MGDMNTGRRMYRMGARATAAADTGRRIVTAMQALTTERFLDDITLDDVAGRAGVTTRTVIRRFGGRDGLIAEAFNQANTEVETRRDETPAGDVGAAVEAVFEDYERYGDGLMMLLAQEPRHPELLGPLLDLGRRDHWRWVERVFSPRDLAHAAELIAATDVYVWKLMRRDIGLDRKSAAAAIKEMLGRLI